VCGDLIAKITVCAVKGFAKPEWLRKISNFGAKSTINNYEIAHAAEFLAN
jgi:hypothetical protein